MLSIGQNAPDFTLNDQHGNAHTLSNYRGQKVVLYFYPKDDTPGCTTQACAIADSYGEFEDKAKVFGVSADSEASHAAFALKYNLPFTLLSDTNLEVIKAYGAYKEEDTTGLGIHSSRITYIIDEEGKIMKVYPDVDPATHAPIILKDLG